MIGGNPNDFLDRIYSGQDTIFIFKGIKYWFQGYAMPNDAGWHMEIFQYQPKPSRDNWFWIYDGKNIEECFEAFVKSCIFVGKTFWEAENEIEWVDE